MTKINLIMSGLLSSSQKVQFEIHYLTVPCLLVEIISVGDIADGTKDCDNHVGIWWPARARAVPRKCSTVLVHAHRYVYVSR